MNCQNCGAELPEGDLQFCPYCGKLLENNAKKDQKANELVNEVCYNCKQKLQDNIYYCPYCGVKLTDYTWGTEFKEYSIEELNAILISHDKTFWTPKRREFILKKFKDENLKSIIQFLSILKYFYLNDKLIDTEIYYLTTLDNVALKEELGKHRIYAKDKINFLLRYKDKEITRRDLFTEFKLKEKPYDGHY